MRSLAAVQSLLAQHARRAPSFFILSTSIIDPDLRLRKCIRRVPVRRNKIDTNRVREGRNEEAQRHDHAKLRAISRIRRSAQDWRNYSTTANGANDPA